MPTLMRLVLAAMAAASMKGEERTERLGAKWASASQTASRPSCSAMSTWAKDSAKASAWVMPSRVWNSMKDPNSIFPPAAMAGRDCGGAVRPMRAR